MVFKYKLEFNVRNIDFKHQISISNLNFVFKTWHLEFEIDGNFEFYLKVLCLNLNFRIFSCRMRNFQTQNYNRSQL